MSASWPESCGARFRRVRLLSTGAQGEVWLATQLDLDRPAVVKLLSPQVAALSDDLVGQFRTEARVTAALAHPGIVVLLDHAVEPGGAWIAYEHVPGGSLADVLAAEGPLPWRRALDAVHQVAEALAVAHAAGVVHRDVKPANILVDGDRVKLADFGIARWDELSGARTAPGVVVGSPAYLSPEVRFGAPAEPTADVFALGVTAQQLITGQLPPRAAEELARRAPPGVVALVERAMAPVVADRVPSAAAFARAVEGLLASDVSASGVRRRARRETLRAPPPVRTRPDGPPTLAPSREAHGMVAVGSLAVAVALGITGFAMTRGVTPRPERTATPAPAAPLEAHLAWLTRWRAAVEQPRATLRPWFGRDAYARGAPLVLPCRGHLTRVHLIPAAGARILTVDGRSVDAGPVTLTGAELRAGVIVIAADGPVAVEFNRTACPPLPPPPATPPALALVADEIRRRFSDIDERSLATVRELAQRELQGRDEKIRRAVTALIDLREKAFWDQRWNQASPGEAFLADHDTAWSGETLAAAFRTLPVVEPLLHNTRDPATGWLELGSIFRLCGQPEASRASLVEALSVWPESHWAWFELAKLEKYRGETPEDPPLTKIERAAHLEASLPCFDQALRLMRRRFALRRDDERYWVSHVETQRRDAARQIGRLREATF